MTGKPLLVKSYWPWAFLAILVAQYLVLAYLIQPGADTLWRLHIADGLLNGQTLYRDLIEVNPPLWFWSAIPAAALGGYPALVAINLVTALAGVTLFVLLASKLEAKGQVWAIAIGLALGLLGVNVAEIGQREQAFLLASVLWSTLVAARIENKSVELPLLLGVTFFAAYGFALKHYFVLVPVALEFLLVWHQRRKWNPFRLETLAMASLAMAYGLAVVVITPDFLGRVLGLVQVSYYGFGPWNAVGPVERQLGILIQCIFAIGPFLLWLVRRPKSVLLNSLVLSFVVALVVVFIQQKGWRYHLIAINGLAILISILLLQIEANDTQKQRLPRFAVLALVAVIASAYLKPAIDNIKSNGQPLTPAIATIVAQEPKGHHIAILSTAPDNAFFPLARAGRAHWSRHFSMWMMPGLLTPQQNDLKDARRREELARVLNEFRSDLTCTPPDVIVGEVGYFKNPKPMLFDAMALLRQDARFAAWVDAYYKPALAVGGYPIWRLSKTKPERRDCTRPL